MRLPMQGVFSVDLGLIEAEGSRDNCSYRECAHRVAVQHAFSRRWAEGMEGSYIRLVSMRKRDSDALLPLLTRRTEGFHVFESMDISYTMVDCWPYINEFLYFETLHLHTISEEFVTYLAQKWLQCSCERQY